MTICQWTGVFCARRKESKEAQTSVFEVCGTWRQGRAADLRGAGPRYQLLPASMLAYYHSARGSRAGRKKPVHPSERGVGVHFHQAMPAAVNFPLDFLSDRGELVARQVRKR
jgi:hypothetical protein